MNADHTEDLITDTLRERTERTAYPTTPMATIAARARVVRAGRRRTTLLTAVAVLGVVSVPAVVWLTRPADTSRVGPGLPDATSTASAVSPLFSLETGTQPGIDYLVGDTYVPTTGDRTSSPLFRRATAATPTRGGILVSVPIEPGLVSQEHFGTTYLVGSEDAQDLGCGADRFAMSTDGTESGYWLADRCQLPSPGKLYAGATSTMGESGPGYAPTAAGSGALEPVGILRQGTVANQWNGDKGSAAIVPPDGKEKAIDLSVAAGSDENNDLVSGQLSARPDVGAVIDLTRHSFGDLAWETAAGWTLGQFSTDGKYVVGRGPEGEFGVFDALDGTRIAAFQPLDGEVFVVQWAWDVDDTLLAVMSDGQDEAIVRFDLTGHATLATPIRSVANRLDVYRLATRP
jgi:hypothetical protein